MHEEILRLARCVLRVQHKTVSCVNPPPSERFFPCGAAELGLSCLSWVSFSVFSASFALNRRTNANTQKQQVFPQQNASKKKRLVRKTACRIYYPSPAGSSHHYGDHLSSG